MDMLLVLLFIVPGLIAEFIYESLMRSKKDESEVYKFLRGIYFNLPLTAFTWLVIWFWKIALHNEKHMIQSFGQFWNKCINEPFLLKYCMVLMAGIIIMLLPLSIIKFIKKRKAA